LGTWPQPVLDACSMHLVTPVAKTCPQIKFTVQVTFPSAVNSLQYATHCQHTAARHFTEQSAVRYTHCQHTAARHFTEQSAVRYTLSAHSCTTLYRTVCSTLHTLSTQLHDTLQNCCGIIFIGLRTVAVTVQ